MDRTIETTVTIIRTAGMIRRESKVVGIDALRLSLNLALSLSTRSASPATSARARHNRAMAAAGYSPVHQPARPETVDQNAVKRFGKAVPAGKCAWPNVSTASARV